MNTLLQTLRGLSTQEEDCFWVEYLKELSRSIKVAYDTTPIDFMRQPGFDAPYGIRTWAQRQESWYSSKGVFCWSMPNGFTEHKNAFVNRKIPIFPNYAIKALKRITYEEHNKEETITMKNQTINTLVNKNKNAVAIAAKLATGKTANSFFLNKLVTKLPWYAKLFGKKKEIESNPLAKLITAQTAMALATHFAPDSKKLNYIAESMVEESIVDISVNSVMLENLIKELEDVVSLPSNLLSE